MALLPSPWVLLAAGIRKKNLALTLAGGLLLVFEIIRRLDGPKRERVYAEKLRPGAAVMVGVLRAGERGGQRRR